MKLKLRNAMCLLSAVLTLALMLGTPCFGRGKDKSKADKKAEQTQEQRASKVDLNTASEKELDALPGVGPATAKKIVDHRPYSSVDDLKKAGIANRTLEKIRPMVTVSDAGSASDSSRKTSKKSDAESSPSSANSSNTSSKKRGEAFPETASSPTASSKQEASDLPQSDATATEPGNGRVWVNLDTKVYHYEGDRWYGKTKHGKYMTEADAQKAGYRPAKNSKKGGH